MYVEVDENCIWNDITEDDVKMYPGLESNGEKGEFEVALRPGTKVIITEVYDENQECVLSNIEGTI